MGVFNSPPSEILRNECLTKKGNLFYTWPRVWILHTVLFHAWGLENVVRSCLLFTSKRTLVHYFRVIETTFTLVKVPQVDAWSGPRAFSLPASTRLYIISASLHKTALIMVEVTRRGSIKPEYCSISFLVFHASAIFKGKLRLAHPTLPISRMM